MNERLKRDNKLIVTIVKKGRAKKICEAAKKAGTKGGTTLMGKGTSAKEFKKMFGITLNEEREVILIVTKNELEEEVFNEVVEKGEINKPGKGIVFVMDLKRVDGIVHLLKEAQE